MALCCCFRCCCLFDDQSILLVMKKILVCTILVFTFLLLGTDIHAQCAMCRATVESNMNQPNSIGSGLNSGILYLMSIPYILIGTIAVFWFRASKNAKKSGRKLFPL